MRYSHVIKRITPRVGTGLAGYSREATSHGIYDDLYLQAVLLDDGKKGRLLLVVADLIGFDAHFVSRMRRWIVGQDAGLTHSSIIFSATHTHCGPGTCRFIDGVGKIDEEYMNFLEHRIKHAVLELLSSRIKPGTLYCGSGSCSLAMNRRLPVKTVEDGKTVKDIAMRPNPDGPVDHHIGVMQIKGQDEEIILFNYACHPTTRGGYLISGDFPAAATRYLRASSYEKREAMFLQGALGDVRVPCVSDDGASFVVGDSDNVVEYGNRLAQAVERILDGNLREVKPSFAAQSVELVLPYSNTEPSASPSQRKDYETLVRWRLENEGDKGIRLEWIVWRLADECVLMALPGEACTMIGKMAKEMSEVAYPFFVGLTNGNPAYIPTDKILREGGYEGNSSMVPYGHPYLLKPGIDEMLGNKLKHVLEKLAQEDNL